MDDPSIDRLLPNRIPEKNTDTATVVPGHSVNVTPACGKLQEDQEPVK